ncbi:MAG: hypothetical protein J0M15_14545 [Deltaproteobacteria bacterium]|jgi:hypothetical protein|nr:hypothetical protein [Deltaproteobacteria bacterium]
MKNVTLLLMPILISLFLTACGNVSPDRQAPPEFFTSVSEELTQTDTLSDPKVNILFVVDNSQSMNPYQTILAENIELFANAFFDNTRIDYRIGVVPVYDSKYLNDQTVYKPSGKRKMNALGKLVPLKGLNDEISPTPLYITRETPQPKQVLKETVLIGTQWGPEAEESFSPVLAVMTDQINSTDNQGFYEQDSYFAVIFLTDADDASPGLSAEDFYQKLVKSKHGDRSKILIAAALPKTTTANCGHSKEKPPTQAFPSLLAASSGVFADLCSESFGSSLAEFGNQLRRRVSTQKKQLSYTPDIETLKISVSNRPIANATTPDTHLSDQDTKNQNIERQLERPKDYTFNPETNEIILNPFLEIKREKNKETKITITAKPASLDNYKTKRLRSL